MLDKLIETYPTTSMDGIVEKPVKSVPLDEMYPVIIYVDYRFNFFRAERDSEKYFFCITLEKNTCILRQALYDIVSGEELFLIHKELKESENPFDLISRKISERKIASRKDKSYLEYHQELKTKKQQDDDRKMIKYQEEFEDKSNLYEAIKKNVFPALVCIKTANGRVGTGFFETPQWLVSNAHVFPCREILDITQIVDHEKIALNLEPEQSYHRPSDNDNSPDVVIIKTNARNNNEVSFSKDIFSQDPCYQETYLFYVDIHSLESSGSPQVRFLDLLSKPNTYPVIYQCQDASIPQPGNSGSPIIEASLMLLGNTQRWKFKTVGVLYARCFANWYNKNQEICTKKVGENTKLLCAIPFAEEFDQVRKIMTDTDDSLRSKSLATVSTSMGEQGIEDSRRYTTMSEQSEVMAKLRLREFESGKTELKIDLPDGLEKLWYDRIIKIEESLFIKEVLRGVVTRKNLDRYLNDERYKGPVDIDTLREDFEDLIREITAHSEIIQFKKEDNFFEFKYFRVDVDPGGEEKKEHWVIKIQDNIGKDLKYNKKSLSSDFATVTLDRQTKINGAELALLLQNSYKTSEIKDISTLPTLKGGTLSATVGYRTGSPIHTKPVDTVSIKELLESVQENSDGTYTITCPNAKAANDFINQLKNFNVCNKTSTSQHEIVLEFWEYECVIATAVQNSENSSESSQNFIQT